MHALSNFLIPLYLSAPSVCTLHVYRNLYDYVKRFTNCPRPMNRYDLPRPHHDIHCVPKPLVVKSLVYRIKRTVNIRIGSSRPLFARPAPPLPPSSCWNAGPALWCINVGRFRERAYLRCIARILLRT